MPQEITLSVRTNRRDQRAQRSTSNKAEGDGVSLAMTQVSRVERIRYWYIFSNFAFYNNICSKFWIWQSWNGAEVWRTCLVEGKAEGRSILWNCGTMTVWLTGISAISRKSESIQFQQSQIWNKISSTPTTHGSNSINRTWFFIIRLNRMLRFLTRWE